MATSYKIRVAADREVFMRELTVQEFEQALKAAGTNPTAWDLAMQGLRRSLVSDAGEELKYQDLVGQKLGQRFSVKQLIMLKTAWEKIHAPDDKENEEEDLGKAEVIVS